MADSDSTPQKPAPNLWDPSNHARESKERLDEINERHRLRQVEEAERKAFREAVDTVSAGLNQDILTLTRSLDIHAEDFRFNQALGDAIRYRLGQLRRAMLVYFPD